MTQVPIPNKQCPWCQAGDETSTVQRVAGKHAPEPKPGDPCLCTLCGKWSVWTADNTLEKPDAKMTKRIADSPEALKLKLALMLFQLTRRKKRKGLSTQALLDIRNKAVDEARDKIFASVQLCERANEALEIYLAVALDQVLQAAVLWGCLHPDEDGEDCIDKVIGNLVNAIEVLDIASLVEDRVKAHRAGEKAGEGSDDS